MIRPVRSSSADWNDTGASAPGGRSSVSGLRARRKSPCCHEPTQMSSCRSMKSLPFDVVSPSESVPVRRPLSASRYGDPVTCEAPQLTLPVDPLGVLEGCAFEQRPLIQPGVEQLGIGAAAPH